MTHPIASHGGTSTPHVVDFQTPAQCLDWVRAAGVNPMILLESLAAALHSEAETEAVSADLALDAARRHFTDGNGCFSQSGSQPDRVAARSALEEVETAETRVENARVRRRTLEHVREALGQL